MIPVFKPLIEKEEIQASTQALQLGWLGMGSYVNKFEKSLVKICKLSNTKKKIIAVSTGHAALHLALLDIGIKKGDEVITPSFNNAADFQAIRACGADPVFVDIDEKTLCIDVKKIENLISKKTKCIIAMDYDLSLCDHRSLKKISKIYKIPILHDAAHSFGSFYKNQPIGNQHQYTMFSFDPVKTITCIDGGALVVDNKKSLNSIIEKRLIGMNQSLNRLYSNSRSWSYDVKGIGFRYHLSNLHAKIGIAQLKKLKTIRNSRNKTCFTYHNGLKDLKEIISPKPQDKNINPFLYYIRVLNQNRDKLRKYLKRRGVDTGIHWEPGHKFSFFKNCRKGSLKVTDKISSEILSIPLHSNMKSKDIQKIINLIRSFYKKDK